MNKRPVNMNSMVYRPLMKDMIEIRLKMRDTSHPPACLHSLFNHLLQARALIIAAVWQTLVGTNRAFLLQILPLALRFPAGERLGGWRGRRQGRVGPAIVVTRFAIVGRRWRRRFCPSPPMHGRRSTSGSVRLRYTPRSGRVLLG